MEKGSFERYAAVKISIKDILEGSYIYESEQNSNYLLTTNNQKIYRINIVAAIIHKEQVGSITSMLIEDGTGKIIIRWFEENESIKNTFIGNICCVVGKIRVYNNEKYISPEIFKKVDLLWLKVRSLELSAKDKNTILQKTNEFYEEKKEVIYTSIIPPINKNPKLIKTRSRASIKTLSSLRLCFIRAIEMIPPANPATK